MWSYDGSTKPIKVSNSSLWGIRDIEEYNGKLYISAWDGNQQPELYSYDETNPPIMIADIRPGTNGSSPINLTNYKGKLYFTAFDGINYNRLYSYDGIDTSSFEIKDNGIIGSSGQNFTVALNKMFFASSSDLHGTELWSLTTPFNNSIDELKEQSIIAYPNPANDIISFESSFPIARIYVYDAMGHIVQLSKNTTLDISRLPKGIYVANIQGQSKNASIKFIKH